MTPPIPRRGEVWFANVPGDMRRPVLILTRDPMGQYLHSVLCAPITSTFRGLTTEVILGVDAGLDRESAANFDNTLLLERIHLLKRMGRVPAPVMQEACQALATAVGCSFR
jgi:mRNA interferase MazF